MSNGARYEHVDLLAGLDQAATAVEKLELVHRQVRRRFPFVTRMAVATYDAGAGVLHTFAHSGGESALAGYQARLAETSSLRQMLAPGRPRVLDDLGSPAPARSEHARRIRRAGYRSSYTLPLRRGGLLWGFLFFDSPKPGAFGEPVLADLDVFGHLVSSTLAQDLDSQRMLRAALDTAVELVHRRDPETGAHLLRMARFARLIARELSEGGARAVDDEFAERLFLFAPLHDIGKIAIPDRILRKPGRLTEDEHTVMKTHGLKGSAIPLEARIVAAADVFDALASTRAYKARWSNDRAFARLERLARRSLDPDCVRALIARRDQVEDIQQRFQDPGDRDGRAA
jgi:hypothetical protein